MMDRKARRMAGFFIEPHAGTTTETIYIFLFSFGGFLIRLKTGRQAPSSK
jgi:hypothetical protein